MKKVRRELVNWAKRNNIDLVIEQRSKHCLLDVSSSLVVTVNYLLKDMYNFDYTSYDTLSDAFDGFAAIGAAIIALETEVKKNNKYTVDDEQYVHLAVDLMSGIGYFVFMEHLSEFFSYAQQKAREAYTDSLLLLS